MATFTGTSGTDIALPPFTLSGFTGGTAVEFFDGVGDVINALGGNDLIFAGSGNDTITGGAGADNMVGSGGQDVFVYNALAEIAGDTIDGGANVNTLRVTYSGTADFTTATIASSGQTSIDRLELTNAGGTDVAFNGSQVSGAAVSPTLSIIAGTGSYAVFLLNVSGTLNLTGFQFASWDADDRIEVRLTGPANVTGSQQRDVVLTSSGIDVVNAGLGNDVIYGSAGADTLGGGGGNDLFIYGTQADVAGDQIDGGADFDTLEFATAGTFDTSGVSFLSIERIDLTGAGNNVIINADQFSPTRLSTAMIFQGSATGPDIITINNASGSFTALQFGFQTWDAAVDRIVINGINTNDNITGSPEADSIAGGNGNDTLRGGAGSDTLRGGSGEDVFVYNAASEFSGDVIDGGSNRNTLRLDFAGFVDLRNVTVASTGTTSIDALEFANAGALAVFLNGSQVGGTGFSQSLAITGSAAADTIDFFNIVSPFSLADFSFTSWNAAVDRIVINGGLLADDFTGSSQADALLGAEGNDTLNGGGGADTLNGGAGIGDIVSFQSSSGARIYVDLANGFAQDGGGAFDVLTDIEGAFGANQSNLANADILLGDNNANIFFGFGGQDYVIGNGGADTIDVGAGANNIALGGTGNDTLIGGADVDFLYGNDGSDSLTGNGGDDWLFTGDFGGAAITGADRAFGGAGNDVIAVGDRGGSFALADGGANNDTIYGGLNANDVIRGGSGSDYLFGQTGVDTYRFETGDLVSGDVDTIFAFNAGDRFSFATSFVNTISVAAGTNAGDPGVYLAHTGSTWIAWLPFRTAANVNSALIFE